MMAKGIIPCDNLYSLWTIGIPQKDYQNIAIEEADLVIAVGYDLSLIHIWSIRDMGIQLPLAMKRSTILFRITDKYERGTIDRKQEENDRIDVYKRQVSQL